MIESLQAEPGRTFNLVKNNFVFAEDYGLEDWKMPPDEYNGRRQIRDDCDGFCLACRSLLRKANISSRLVYCQIEEGRKSYGHLVVEAQGWILDNRQLNVLPNTSIYLADYNWLRISGYEPGDEWYEVV
jgi:predicted transglutaminase-like cysteine proteinase